MAFETQAYSFNPSRSQSLSYYVSNLHELSSAFKAQAKDLSKWEQVEPPTLFKLSI